MKGREYLSKNSLEDNEVEVLATQTDHPNEADLKPEPAFNLSPKRRGFPIPDPEQLKKAEKEVLI